MRTRGTEILSRSFPRLANVRDSPGARRLTRDQLAADVAAYLARGGTIEPVPPDRMKREQFRLNRKNGRYPTVRQEPQP